jgi:hypothetical protein
MLRLDLAREPRWFDLGHGVRVRCEPITTTVIAAARRSPSIKTVDPVADPEAAGIALAVEVAKRVIVGWEGVGDAAGKPLPVTPEGIEALLEVWAIAEAFHAKVLGPPMLVESEKNGFAPSPAGTSAVAKNTARPVKGRAPSAPQKPTRRKA